MHKSWRKGLPTVTGAVWLLFALAAMAAPRTFVPDVVFTGSSLTGWHPVGQADWKAQNGEIVGTPKTAEGGWLVLDKSFQDIGVVANFRCTGGCKTGVLFRAEKTADGGMKGVLVSLNASDVNAYNVALDSQGKEVSRERLKTGPTGRTDFVTFMYPAEGGGGGAAAGRGGAPQGSGQGGAPPGQMTPAAPAGVEQALAGEVMRDRPAGALHAGQWNELEIIMDAQAPKLLMNEGGVTLSGVTSYMGFGPIALYVGGTGEVHLKDFGYKDLNRFTYPKEETSSRFRMQRLREYYLSWSAGVADVNHDGVNDIVSGAYAYYGPDYTTSREIYIAESYDVHKQYPRACAVNFAYDFTGDGWADQWCATGNNGMGPGVLYVNPRNEPRRWERFEVTPDVWIEETALRDVDGDGKPELIMGIPGGTIVLARPDPANPTKPWMLTPISDAGPWAANNSHGLGVGDLNQDGRLDILTAWGWWEQPAKGSAQKLWTYHPEAFGRRGRSQGAAGGAEMAVYDVNGDGLNDVVTSLEAHGWGLAWFEQKKSADGKPTFVRHMIMDNFQTKNAGDVIFTELHGATAADMNGDGIQDFIVGKRYMSHFGYTDPDSYGAPVLYIYRTVRNPSAPGGAEFVPELVHNRSGVGSHIVAMDINKDGATDIVTSSTHGTYIFWGNNGAATQTAR